MQDRLWKLLDQAGQLFDRGSHSPEDAEHKVKELHAKIGQLTIGQGLCVRRGNFGLVESQAAGVAGIQQYGCELLCGCAGGGDQPPWST
jgi:hypothetical protein